MNPFAGRKGVNPDEVDSRGFLINALKAMKIKINNVIQTPDSGGYVNIPYVSSVTPGLVRSATNQGTSYTSSGTLVGYTQSLNEYTTGATSIIICKGTLENIKHNLIKSVLTDTATNVWSDAERLAVLTRLGVTVDQTTGAMTWSAQT